MIKFFIYKQVVLLFVNTVLYMAYFDFEQKDFCLKRHLIHFQVGYFLYPCQFLKKNVILLFKITHKHKTDILGSYYISNSKKKVYVCRLAI